MTHVTCRLTAKNRDQLRNRTLGNRVWATFTFYLCRRAVERDGFRQLDQGLYADDVDDDRRCRVDRGVMLYGRERRLGGLPETYARSDTI